MYVIILEESKTCAKHYCFICSELTFEFVYIIHVLYIHVHVHVQILLKGIIKLLDLYFPGRVFSIHVHVLYTMYIHVCV